MDGKEDFWYIYTNIRFSTKVLEGNIIDALFDSKSKLV